MSETATTETEILSDSSDNQTTDWKDGLSDELKVDPTLANIKDVESAAKTLIHQQKMLGSRIPMPKTDEEKQELYTKLGRPESSEDYQIEIPIGYEEHYHTEMMSSFKEQGHKLGLSSEQMQGLVDWQKNMFDSQQSQSETQGDALREATETDLKKEFGVNFSKNMIAAKRALDVYGNEALADKLANPMYGNDPDLIRLLANAGKNISEDSATGTTNNNLVMGKHEAQMRIDEINNAGKSHPYWDAKNPRHIEAVAEMEQLFAKAHS